jgi:hypothetical protein
MESCSVAPPSTQVELPRTGGELNESTNLGVGTLMEMETLRTKSIGSITRIVGKRIAVLALCAFMLGIIIHEGVPGQDAAAATQDYPPGPTITSQDYPPGPSVADIVVVG